MPLPIVIAYHLVWTGYGWWFPNDPRGSMSRFIASDVLAQINDLHYGRKKLQPTRGQLLDFFRVAQPNLKFEPFLFTPPMVAAIGKAFAEVIAAERYTCYACAIMRDHVHVLIRKHKHSAEQMIANLQRESHLRLREEVLRDFEHPIWGGHGWSVFQDHPDDIRRTIKYIEDNPLPLGQPRQVWDFVKEYDGWPLHPGHSPNSPYVKRMRKGR
jgi:REP element-mobilizing transposase RayT